MGIPKDSCQLLLKEHQRKPLGGSLLTLGVQDIHFTKSALYDMAERYNFPIKKSVLLNLSAKQELSARQFIDDISLFRALGFTSVNRLDYSDFENADITFNLNEAELPPELHNRFDMIIDGGTMEHVFHVPNLLSNIFKMLKLNGRIVHLSPSSNYIDHGFYMFSPTFFYDYYSANQFEINKIQLSRHSRQRDSESAWIADYTPDMYDLYASERAGGSGDSYLISCIATKTENSTDGVVPQQGDYKNKRWKKHFQFSQREFESKMDEVLSFVKSNQVELTLAKFPSLIEMAPDDGKLHHMYAKLLASNGRLTDAIHEYEIANYYITNPEINYDLARLLFELKRFDEAREYVGELSKISSQWKDLCSKLEAQYSG